MEHPVRVILFEDNRAYQDSLEMYFEDSGAVYLTAMYDDARNALAQVREHRPDVVLMDIQMPEVTGIEALQQIKAAEPDSKILIQTSFDDKNKIFAALCGGASGYVLKSAGPEATEQAILEVSRGGGYFSPAIASKVIDFFRNNIVTSQVEYIELTPAEHEVLECMSRGMSYKMIEAELDKSYSAVHFHIKNIYKKLHVNSMTEAVVKAIKNHLI